MTGIFMSNVQIFNTGSVSTTFVDLKYSKCESNVNDKERQNMQPFEASRIGGALERDRAGL